jgi:hypothetical protein
LIAVLMLLLLLPAESLVPFVFDLPMFA